MGSAASFSGLDHAVRRLPRRVHLAGYVVGVQTVSQRHLRGLANEGSEAWFDGWWESALGRDGPLAGTIYIWSRLPARQKWSTFWHELIHAVNDIAAWDQERVIT